MSAQETTRHGGGIGSALVTAVYLLVGAASLIGIFLVVKPFLTPTTLTDIFTIPTAAVTAPRPAGVPQVRPQAPAQPAAPAVDVNQAIDAYNATATAAYQQAIQAQPQPNVDNLPANAPAVEYGSKPSALEQSNGIVPTSEPIDQATVNDQFGSKPAKPVNIQETHQCLHAQVWVDGRGCKNPTPTQ